MGAFLVNFHVRCDSAQCVAGALRRLPGVEAWIAGPHGDWVTFWESQASQQNSDRIQYIAEHVSRNLDTSLIAFLVHDSDVLCYWLYDCGTRLDEYSSSLGYWGNDAIDDKPSAVHCRVLVKYCGPGTNLGELERILTQQSRAGIAAGPMPGCPFAEMRLTQIAPSACVARRSADDRLQ